MIGLPSLVKNLIPLSSACILSACATAPVVDSNWLAQNCMSIPRFQADSCNAWSNCKTIEKSICSCSHEEGTVYEGELLQGNRHGWGKFTWTDGSIYAGYWIQNEKFCGVEERGSNFVVITNGRITDQGGATAWADAFAAALVIGAVGYAVGESGAAAPYSSNTDYDWDWDFQPGNNQWVCRGIQSGQYASLEKCAFDIQDDDRWP